MVMTMSTMTFERVQTAPKAKTKKFTTRHVIANASSSRIDVDGLEKASREGLKKAIQDGTTPSWVRVI